MIKNVYNLQDGEIGRDQNGNYWLMKNGQIHNEFGPTYALSHVQVEIVKEKPRLTTGKTFFYKGPKNPTPFNNLLFELNCGWRFRCPLSVNYDLEIPFWFQSTDPRVGWAKAVWRLPSAKLFHHLFEASTFDGLHISYAPDEPILLYIAQIHGYMEVPSK